MSFIWGLQNYNLSLKYVCRWNIKEHESKLSWWNYFRCSYHDLIMLKLVIPSISVSHSGSMSQPACRISESECITVAHRGSYMRVTGGRGIGDEGGRVWVAGADRCCVHWCDRMNSVSWLADNSIESVVVVSGVVDSSSGAIRFNEAVVPLNFVSMSLLGLFLDVVGMTILNSVLKLVISRSLENIY